MRRWAGSYRNTKAYASTKLWIAHAANGCPELELKVEEYNVPMESCPFDRVLTAGCFGAQGMAIASNMERMMVPGTTSRRLMVNGSN